VKNVRASVILLLSCCVPAQALASDAETSNVTVRLVSEVPAIRQGETFFVALQMTMAPSWHTYWKNPGDSGTPTRLVWTLPDGFRASELRWPVPARGLDAGLVRYGYEREALFLTEITAGADLPKGRFTLSAKVSWLECKDICIPRTAAVEIVLPSADAASRVTPDPSTRALFTRARASMPRSDPALKVSHAFEGDRLILKVTSPPPTLGSPLEFFPEAAGLIKGAEPQIVSRAVTGWTVSMKRAPNALMPQALRGVLISLGGGRRIAWEMKD